MEAVGTHSGLHQHIQGGPHNMASSSGKACHSIRHPSPPEERVKMSMPAMLISAH